jgi:tetratricopeptide (TPR) repeat protein
MSARAELGTLEASGLIQIAALQPELEYLFRHALVQEAAYASLLKQDRRTLHRAAAEAILALHPDRERELAGVIAMHLEQAGEAERAATYLLQAGDHALERFANRESMAFFARAGVLAGDAHPNTRLQAAIGGAKSGWGYEGDTHIHALEQALAAADRADPLLLTEAYFWLAFLRRQRGESPESSPELKQAMERGAEIGRSLQDPAAAALPRALMGSFIAFMGGLREGANEMRAALDQIEAKGDPVSMAMVSDFLAMSYSRLGEFAAAEKTIERAASFAGDGDAIARVDVDISRSALALERGEADKARDQARECSERAESLGAFACVVASNTMFGAASLAREDPLGARAHLERGSELSRVTNMAPMRTLLQGLLGSTRARMGDMPGGIAGWDAALADARGMGDRYGEAQTLWGRGRTYAHSEQWSTALPDLNRAVELFEGMEARPALARALYDRARVLGGLGHKAEAEADEKRAIDLGRELGLRDEPFVAR